MKKFFEGLSISSIVAGALAAVTSFLLASKIGIAGSVIGAAASYIVSAVATNIYQNVLQASGEKLQSVGSTDDDAAEPPAMRRMPNRATISIDPRGLKRQPAKIPKTPWLLQPRQVKLLPASAPLPHPLHVRRPPPSAPPPHQLQAVAHLARLFLARLHSVRATRIPSRNCAHHAAIPSAQLLS